MGGADQVRFASCLPLAAVRLLFFRKGGDPERYFPAPGADLRPLGFAFPLPTGSIQAPEQWRWNMQLTGMLEVVLGGSNRRESRDFPCLSRGFHLTSCPKTPAVVGSVDGGCHGARGVGSPCAEGPAASFQPHPVSTGSGYGFRPIRLLGEHAVPDAEKTQKPR